VQACQPQLQQLRSSQLLHLLVKITSTLALAATTPALLLRRLTAASCCCSCCAAASSRILLLLLPLLLLAALLQLLAGCCRLLQDVVVEGLLCRAEAQQRGLQMPAGSSSESRWFLGQ
jgi:hypothetical protein